MEAVAPIAWKRVREEFDYDPESGSFTWRKGRTGTARPGSRVGSFSQKGYLVTRFCGVNYPVHRLIWYWMTGAFPKDQVDHINGVKHDNRWTNLREATNSQNVANTGANSRNSSGFKGVYHHEAGKWQAKVMHLGKSKSLGLFDSPEQAARAYNEGARARFGDFAYQNEVPH